MREEDEEQAGESRPYHSRGRAVNPMSEQLVKFEIPLPRYPTFKNRVKLIDTGKAYGFFVNGEPTFLAKTQVKEFERTSDDRIKFKIPLWLAKKVGLDFFQTD